MIYYDSQLKVLSTEHDDNSMNVDLLISVHVHVCNIPNHHQSLQSYFLILIQFFIDV